MDVESHRPREQMTPAQALRELRRQLVAWRCERPDEWRMDEFIRLIDAASREVAE